MDPCCLFIPHMCLNVHSHTAYNGQEMNVTESPPTDERIKKMWDMCTWGIT